MNVTSMSTFHLNNAPCSIHLPFLFRAYNPACASPHPTSFPFSLVYIAETNPVKAPWSVCHPHHCPPELPGEGDAESGGM